MLTSWEVAGSATELATDAMAARWNTASTPRHAFRQRSASRMSPSTMSTSPPNCRRFSGEPVLKLSSTRTCHPSRRRRPAKWLPMKPAPPVINAVCPIERPPDTRLEEEERCQRQQIPDVVEEVALRRLRQLFRDQDPVTRVDRHVLGGIAVLQLLHV